MHEPIAITDNLNFEIQKKEIMYEIKEALSGIKSMFKVNYPVVSGNVFV